mgnify:CR=1 FL=1
MADEDMIEAGTANASPATAHADIEIIQAKIEEESAFVSRLQDEGARVIVGQRYMVERLLIGLLADGHVLMEGVPGLAKTLTVSTLAKVIETSFQRIQFTPDLLPADRPKPRARPKPRPRKIVVPKQAPKAERKPRPARVEELDYDEALAQLREELGEEPELPPAKVPMIVPAWVTLEPEVPIWPAPVPSFSIDKTSSAVSPPETIVTVRVPVAKSALSESVTVASASIATAPAPCVGSPELPLAYSAISALMTIAQRSCSSRAR